jgi:hypothetical protein
MIDINFKTYSDAGGGDPDATSKTLRAYHKFLWSKPLPNGLNFQLRDDVPKTYLHSHSELGEFALGSDAITHSYRNQKKKEKIIKQIPNQANELFELGSTIGAYIIFPNKQIGRKPTINQERGINAFIDDRFDLTLECIRKFYQGEQSPLFDTLTRYATFFNLFLDFKGYVDFFLLNDLLNNNLTIKFYLQFDDFKSKPSFKNTRDYMVYKERVTEFVHARSQRMLDFCNKA